MSPALDSFLKTWRGSAGNERANFQSFLRDFCAALDLPVPEPKGPGATYCFEQDLKLTHLDGTTTGAIDLHREGCFVLEAKQGSSREAPGSSPVRGTRAYDRYMEAAFGQAVNYARNLPHGIAQTEILRQLHGELDAAVAEAYGWPVDLPEADTLLNLVALNKERAAEEARGRIRWLRPDYQAPEALTATTPALLPAEAETLAAASAPLLEPQPWPRDLKDHLAALRAVLMSSARLWALEDQARAFRSRGRYRQSIAAHLDLLADLGMLSRVDTADGPRWHRLQAMGA